MRLNWSNLCKLYNYDVECAIKVYNKNKAIKDLCVELIDLENVFGENLTAQLTETLLDAQNTISIDWLSEETNKVLFSPVVLTDKAIYEVVTSDKIAKGEWAILVEKNTGRYKLFGNVPSEFFIPPQYQNGKEMKLGECSTF